MRASHCGCCALILLAACAGCGRKSEWVVDKAQLARALADFGSDAPAGYRVWKGADGAPASAEDLDAIVASMGKSLRDAVRDRLKRFRRFHAGPPVRESEHLLFALGPRRKGALVSAYIFANGKAQWALLELPSASRWESRLADLVHSRIPPYVPEDEVRNAKPLLDDPRPFVFQSGLLGPVPLPDGWFDRITDGLASPPDPGDGTLPALAVPRSAGFVDVQASRIKKGRFHLFGFSGFRPFDASKLKDGVSVLPGPPARKRALVVRRGDVFVILIETDGPVRDKLTSTEALARFFDGWLKKTYPPARKP